MWVKKGVPVRMVGGQEACEIALMERRGGVRAGVAVGNRSEGQGNEDQRRSLWSWQCQLVQWDWCRECI